MKIEADKAMLVKLIRGCFIDYKHMDIPLVKANGTFSASYGRWDWQYNAFENCTEEQLWNLYKELT